MTIVIIVMMIVHHLEEVLSPINFSTKLHPLEVIRDLLKMMLMKDKDGWRMVIEVMMMMRRRLGKVAPMR